MLIFIILAYCLFLAHLVFFSVLFLLFGSWSLSFLIKNPRFFRFTFSISKIWNPSDLCIVWTISNNLVVIAQVLTDLYIFRWALLNVFLTHVWKLMGSLISGLTKYCWSNVYCDGYSFFLLHFFVVADLAFDTYALRSASIDKIPYFLSCWTSLNF